jgi:PadR family transcriptional regulator, regulatory protein AphA
MSLDYAILGFLNYQPFTGYDLKKLFDTSVRHFWSADQSQIYRTLARLTEQGWATVEVIEQTERPDRKLYHITPAGKDALLAWLGGPFPVQEAHSAPMIQVFFSAQLSDAQNLERFKNAAQLFRTVLSRYEQVPRLAEEYIQLVDSPREAYFWMLTLDLGMRSMQANLAWAEQIIQQLETGQVPAR